MASEGVHLSLGGGSMEEVTCTVIGGVSSTQMCMSDSKRQAEDNDCMTGELHRVDVAGSLQSLKCLELLLYIFFKYWDYKRRASNTFPANCEVVHYVQFGLKSKIQLTSMFNSCSISVI